MLESSGAGPDQGHDPRHDLLERPDERLRARQGRPGGGWGGGGLADGHGGALPNEKPNKKPLVRMHEGLARRERSVQDLRDALDNEYELAHEASVHGTARGINGGVQRAGTAVSPFETAGEPPITPGPDTESDQGPTKIGSTVPGSGRENPPNWTVSGLVRARPRRRLIG